MKKFVLVVLMIFSIFSISVSAQEEYLKGKILKLEDYLSPEEEVEDVYKRQSMERRDFSIF